jgi:Cu-Zn family superoxide dismutase
MARQFPTLFCSLALVAAVGCGGGAEPTGQTAAEAAGREIKKAIAWINPRSGNTDMGGSAIFIRVGDNIDLQVSVEQAPPGPHAVHIHETGDCSADDASSAGGHWNPDGHDHGQWGEGVHHLGDIGNLEVDEEGKGSLTLTTDRWSMGDGGPNDILEKAVIVHVDADDFETQPTGNAGGRIGCGVIKAQ